MSYGHVIEITKQPRSSAGSRSGSRRRPAELRKKGIVERPKVRVRFEDVNLGPRVGVGRLEIGIARRDELGRPWQTNPGCQILSTRRGHAPQPLRPCTRKVPLSELVAVRKLEVGVPDAEQSRHDR